MRSHGPTTAGQCTSFVGVGRRHCAAHDHEHRRLTAGVGGGRAQGRYGAPLAPRSARATYARAHARTCSAFIVYDLTKRATFERVVDRWLVQLRTHTHQSIVLCLIGNKADLASAREVLAAAGPTRRRSPPPLLS
jgi:hypothetical protein